MLYRTPEGFRLNTSRRRCVSILTQGYSENENKSFYHRARGAPLRRAPVGFHFCLCRRLGRDCAACDPDLHDSRTCPGPGYIWTPGYWAYGDFGYYWVPGVWVYPPQIGFLWTPGYWGYRGGSYAFNDGYWGPTVGFYGGINYGNGYIGHGYYGGQWSGGVFRYNTAVSRVNTAVIHNTYVNREVVSKNVGSRAGFNGPGGAKAKPTKQEQAAAKAERVPATSEQRARVDAAKNDPALHAKNNKGKPNAEAVKTFDGNHGRQAADGGPTGAGKQAGDRNQAGDGNQAGARKQSGVANQASAEKAKRGTAQPANRSHQAAQADRSPKKTTVASAGHSTQAKQSSQHNKKVAAPQATRHAQTVAHRPPVRAKQAPPAAGRGAPANAQQPAKKKKKKHGEEG